MEGLNKRFFLENQIGLLRGCTNRMCITKEEAELVRLSKAAKFYIDEIFKINYQRIKEILEEEKDV